MSLNIEELVRQATALAAPARTVEMALPDYLEWFGRQAAAAKAMVEGPLKDARIETLAAGLEVAKASFPLDANAQIPVMPGMEPAAGDDIQEHDTTLEQVTKTPQSVTVSRDEHPLTQSATETAKAAIAAAADADADADADAGWCNDIAARVRRREEQRAAAIPG